MFRTLVATSIIILILIPMQLRSQASKQLDERAKKVATPQQDS
ncbi:MAG: hypothetical protein HW412_764, partial [Bacteroidetes bacterium]|nr:hypothetical protein [Bacteroidota bacterium]